MVQWVQPNCLSWCRTDLCAVTIIIVGVILIFISLWFQEVSFHWVYARYIGLFCFHWCHLSARVAFLALSDTFDHGGLLNGYGNLVCFAGCALQWLCSFLSLTGAVCCRTYSNVVTGLIWSATEFDLSVPALYFLHRSPWICSFLSFRCWRYSRIIY